MAADVLVERHITAGRHVIADLRRAGVDVSAAAWLEVDPAGGYWRLYLVTASLNTRTLTDLYAVVQRALETAERPVLGMSDVRLVRPDEAIGRELLRLVGEYEVDLSCGTPFTHHAPELQRLGFGACQPYPPDAHLTPRQVVRAVADLLGSGELESAGNGALRLATVERGNTVTRVRPTGIRFDPGSRRLVVDAWHPDTNTTEVIPADEITDIRVQ